MPASTEVDHPYWLEWPGPKSRLSKLLYEHAAYLDSYVGFVGSNAEIASVMREAARTLDANDELLKSLP